MDTKHVRSSVIVFFVGLGVGAVTALLMAPKSGKETREMIGRKAEEGSEFVAAKGRELRKRAEDFVDKGKQTAEKLADKSRAFAEKIV
jgi:gas vesicle protein